MTDRGFSSGPLIIGHRGAAGDGPENTLAAFDLARRQGADGIEFDVRFSADRAPVVIHDARLERTTNGAGRVDRHSLAALRRLDAGTWFNRQFPARARTRYAGQRIPLLAEVLAWVKERRCLALVEIKQRSIIPAGLEERVLEEIHRAQVRGQVTAISFQSATLRRLRKLDRTLALGLDFTRPALAIERAQRIGAGMLAGYGPLVSRRFIERAHGAGRQVFLWGVEDPADLRPEIVERADGIITGFPARWVGRGAPTADRGEV